MNEDSRLNEWFVPKFGSLKFRVFIGLLFLPYTGMCISFTIIGAMLAPTIDWERVAAITLIYGLALGVSAHAADSLGSKKNKPWGNYFSRSELWLLLILSLAIAYSIGVYYIIFHVPLLLVIAALEGFFVFAYNFELFKGFLHNDLTFVFSWGALPVLGGYIMQTNDVGTLPFIVSVGAALISYTLGETGNFIEAPFTPGLPRNVSGIDDPKINALRASFQESSSVEERKKLMKQLQEVATETMYYVPIPQAPTYAGFQPNVRNVIEYRSQSIASSVQDIPWWWKA